MYIGSNLTRTQPVMMFRDVLTQPVMKFCNVS